MRENCRTVDQALASITTLDELRGYIDGLKRYGAVDSLTRAEWQKIAHSKIEFEKREC